MVHLVNKKSWDKLTPEQQKIVTEESFISAKLARKLLRDAEDSQLADLQATKGMVVAKPDLKPWKDAMGPAWAKVKTRVGAENFDRFMAMVEAAN
jgi:TRAP-type C4-dicarboxylate transport system substrate-binding protein